MKIIKDKIFDKQLYERISDHNWLAEFNLKKALQLLNEEGMPTTLDFLQTITKDEDSLHSWVVEQQRARLSGAFVTSAERDVIITGFRNLYDKLNPALQSLRSSMNSSLVLKSDGDSVINDAKAVDKKQREQATLTIDADKCDAYYQVFLKLIMAHQELVQYEKDNGYFPQSTELKFNELTNFGWHYANEGTVMEDLFATIHRHKFLKK